MMAEAKARVRRQALTEAASAILNLPQGGVPLPELEGRKAAVNAIAGLPGAGDVFGWVNIEGWALADLKALFARDGSFDLKPGQEGTQP